MTVLALHEIDRTVAHHLRDRRIALVHIEQQDAGVKMTQRLPRYIFNLGPLASRMQNAVTQIVYTVHVASLVWENQIIGPLLDRLRQLPCAQLGDQIFCQVDYPLTFSGFSATELYRLTLAFFLPSFGHRYGLFVEVNRGPAERDELAAPQTGATGEADF